MPSKNLDPNNLGQDEDWEGNNAAFKCPHCGKVFIVSGTRMHGGTRISPGVRKCPQCGKSIARCSMGGRKGGGTASLEW